ncbi:hypothetical protein GGR52DRAFT_181733 [Hypoxylon sp. FL1284]|nr:hypothetical protein GGR52DRAFT_181733 [Hypoxylon sp. FL1284]
MATIDKLVNLEAVENTGIDVSLDTQYPFSPLTPTSIIEDLPNDAEQAEQKSSATVEQLEKNSHRPHQSLSSRAMNSNVKEHGLYQLNLEEDPAAELGLSAKAAARVNSPRQRPRAATPAAFSSTPQPKSKREKNRTAARKCRKKAKLNVEWLKEREEYLSRGNRELKRTAGDLRNEVLCLKDEILRHGQYCESDQMKNYLAKVAGDLVQKDIN